MSQVRISPDTHELLRILANEAGKPMQEIIDRAVEEYRRSSFLRGLNEDFRTLRENKKAWNDHVTDMSAWKATITDGLNEDDEDQTG